MLILMAAFTTASFAGDNDVIKMLKKCKTYGEAQAILNDRIGEMTTASGKAKAYNMIVELAYKKATKDMSDYFLASVASRKDEKVPMKEVFYDEVLAAIRAALECEQYDIMPNEKGTVNPAFHEKNAKRLHMLRAHLLEAGLYYQNFDTKKAFDNIACYVDIRDASLFAEQPALVSDKEYATTALTAALMASKNEDWENVLKYSAIARKDAQRQKDADMLDYKAWAGIGVEAMTASDYDKAIMALKKALELRPENAPGLTFLGNALLLKAREVNDAEGHTSAGRQKMQSLAKEAKGYLEKAKALDPEQEESQWAHPLQLCDYFLQ